MTREELLTFIKNTKDYGWHFTSNSGEDIPVDEVISKMESALEQEPCEVSAETWGEISGAWTVRFAPNEPCDAISRQAILDKLNEWDWQELYLPVHFKEYIIDELPSVQPSRKGHWETSVDRWGEEVTTVNGYRCSECGEFNGFNDNFCPNCGADMRGAE